MWKVKKIGFSGWCGEDSFTVDKGAILTGPDASDKPSIPASNLEPENVWETSWPWHERLAV